MIERCWRLSKVSGVKNKSVSGVRNKSVSVSGFQGSKFSVSEVSE